MTDLTDLEKIFTNIILKIEQFKNLSFHTIVREEKTGGYEWVIKPTIPKWVMDNKVQVVRTLNDIVNAVPVRVVGGTLADPVFVSTSAGTDYFTISAALAAGTTTYDFMNDISLFNKTANGIYMNTDQTIVIRINDDASIWTLNAGEIFYYDNYQIRKLQIVTTVTTNINIWVDN